MKETRPERFKRLAEARVNKLIAMIRLLGNLSNSLIYEYRPDQVAQIFSVLQSELNRARNRFYQNRGERVRFSLSDTSAESLSEEHEPNFEIQLPDGSLLRAVGFEEDTYPGVCVYVRSPGKPREIVSLIEYNPEKNEGHRLCIGAYQSHLGDPIYYEPFVAERTDHERSDDSADSAH